MAVTVKRITIEADSIDISTKTSDDDERHLETVTVTGETHQAIPWRQWRITIEELEHADM